MLYAATIFLSAFLLFEVQPMIGKIILPWFGGSASVWNTCLLFFQASLVAGYLYAHCTTRYLNPRRQALLHMALLAVSIALLPILPSPDWKPARPGDPSGRILLLLAATIGLPYILLSTTSPLLQAWYVAARPGAVPYRLFALSNFGSLLALVSFPLLVEPLASTHTQAYGWSAIYVLFAVLCAAIGWKAGPAVTQTSEPVLEDIAPSWKLRMLWIALAACGSALLLSITTHLSTNVAPIPLLWVLTLGIYLVTFIVCFERERIYHRAVFFPLLVVALGGAAFALYYNKGNLTIEWSIPAFLVTLFICCMACHGELARLKPDPRHLTSFYLMVALGGALGGLFVAILSPHLFHTYAELPFSMVACPALVAMVLWIAPGHWPRKFTLPAVRIAMPVFTLALAIYIGYQKHLDDQRFELSVRNYYGVLRVYDLQENANQTGARKLIHGTISHGTQLTDPEDRDTPTSYYGPKSGLGRAIRYFEQRPAVRVGMIGLGAGVTAAYGRPGDFFRFYDINPLDFSVANTWFTFLKDCRADHQVLLGDARLTLERQPSQQFDVLGVDAFSSDAIPAHLLTREAFVLYFRHLNRGGILAVHVSNRYLSLEPVVARNALDLGKAAIQVNDDGEDEDYLSESDWVLVATDGTLFTNSLFHASGIKPAKPRPGLRPWTDDYSNLIRILK